MRRVLVLAAVLVSGVPFPSVAQPRRSLTVDDLYNLREVREPQRSPDGKWVAYTVTSIDKAADRRRTARTGPRSRALDLVRQLFAFVLCRDQLLA